jgi:hypothetical protein
MTDVVDLCAAIENMIRARPTRHAVEPLREHSTATRRVSPEITIGL